MWKNFCSNKQDFGIPLSIYNTEKHHWWIWEFTLSVHQEGRRKAKRMEKIDV